MEESRKERSLLVRHFQHRMWCCCFRASGFGPPDPCSSCLGGKCGEADVPRSTVQRTSGSSLPKSPDWPWTLLLRPRGVPPSTPPRSSSIWWPAHFTPPRVCPLLVSSLTLEIHDSVAHFVLLQMDPELG